MCVIIIKPKNVPLPGYSTLQRASRQNPHGCGFVVQGSRPFKSLSFDTFYKRLQKVDASLPIIIHFRYATHGAVCDANCHPFFDNKTGISFAHNGILSVQCRNGWTDSETAFRELFLPIINKYGINSPKLHNAVECVRNGSRLAFMSPNGNIKTFGHYYMHDNCMYSNPNSFFNVWQCNRNVLTL